MCSWYYLCNRGGCYCWGHEELRILTVETPTMTISCKVSRKAIVPCRRVLSGRIDCKPSHQLLYYTILYYIDPWSSLAPLVDPLNCLGGEHQLGFTSFRSWPMDFVLPNLDPWHCPMALPHGIADAGCGPSFVQHLAGAIWTGTVWSHGWPTLLETGRRCKGGFVRGVWWCLSRHLRLFVPLLLPQDVCWLPPFCRVLGMAKKGRMKTGQSCRRTWFVASFFLMYPLVN